MSEGTMLARLKPYNKKKGHVKKFYSVKRHAFHEDKGWKPVPADIAEYLKTVHQIDTDPDSPLAFDVCTVEEAKAIDAKEHAQTIVKTPAERAAEMMEAQSMPEEPTPKPEEPAPTPKKKRRGRGAE